MDDKRDTMCRNGGTCKHIGAEAVRCHCAPGYTGNSCEIQFLNDTHGDCLSSTCIKQCTYSPETQKPCDCTDRLPVYDNRARYECRIKLANFTAIRNGANTQPGSIEALLRKHLAKYLRNSNISTVEDLKILSVTPSAEVTFNFFGVTGDGDRIRETLNRLVQRRRLSDFSLESTHFTFQQKPSLRLQSLRVNHVNERDVRLGDQFILSCIAQGSDEIKFIWYKDDMLVNMSKSTREIWYRELPDDGTDVHTSLLTIDKATLLDAGQYTCRAIDWGMEQCKSINIDVRDEPDVKVVPMSATIEKGNNIQLLCITPNMRSLGIGFGWTKNRALLKLEPGHQVWEDLYPAGSILKIINAQKSAIYTCNIAQRSMSVRVEVVNRTLIPICPEDYSWGLIWPETGPNSEALLECPRDFVGPRVSRLCSMRDASTSIWQLPDFSECSYQPFIVPYSNFRSLTLGYQNTTGAKTIISLWEAMRSRKLPLYPGEGDRLLSILSMIEDYQRSINDLDDLYNSAEALTRIVNRILNDENSILTRDKQLLVQELTLRNLGYWTRLLIYPYKHLALSSIVVDIQALHAVEDDWREYLLQVPVDDYMYPPWYSDRITIRLIRSEIDVNINKTFSGIVIVYKNITKFLPTTYVKELEDGTDLEYRFNSRLVTVALSPSLDDRSDSKVQIELRMRYLQNITGSWNVSCGVEDHTGSWDLDSCAATLIRDESSTQCLCTKPGTFAVFLTARATKDPLAHDNQTTFIVLLGCELCLLQSTISSFILVFHLWKNRSWMNFLKLQCATAVVGAMAVFIYAIQSSLSESSYAIVAVTLEAFLLIGMSSPISQALIIYADLTQVRPSQQFQPTVIAVITGLPIICILTTELTHKSTGWRHESWWLIFGTGVYNIFVSCVATMLSIFLVLYSGILWKAHALMDQRSVKRKSIDGKIGLLHRAALTVCGLIVVEAASILYVNSSSVIYHYFFGGISIVLGFVILLSYIGGGEVRLFAPILRKLRFQEDVQIKSDSIKFPGKTTESQNEGTTLSSGTMLNGRGCRGHVGSTESHDYIKEMPPSHEKSSRYPRRPDPRVSRTDDINLENYSTSPRKYHESRKYSKTISPQNQYCPRGFHEVNSRSIQPQDSPKLVNSRDIQTSTCADAATAECSTTVLCSVDIETRIGLSAMPDVTLATKSDTEHSNNVEIIPRDIINVIPDIASTGGRKQPDGEEKSEDIGNCENTAGMLDRISHDLDYLLNRTGEEA
uniref:BAI3 protein n=1 Tax=Fopius arisanus TaxID=64838 RepID=A0A0C9RMD4_9HYME